MQDDKQTKMLFLVRFLSLSIPGFLPRFFPLYSTTQTLTHTSVCPVYWALYGVYERGFCCCFDRSTYSILFLVRGTPNLDDRDGTTCGTFPLPTSVLTLLFLAAVVFLQSVETRLSLVELLSSAVVSFLLFSCNLIYLPLLITPPTTTTNPPIPPSYFISIIRYQYLLGLKPGWRSR